MYETVTDVFTRFHFENPLDAMDCLLAIANFDDDSPDSVFVAHDSSNPDDSSLFEELIFALERIGDLDKFVYKYGETYYTSFRYDDSIAIEIRKNSGVTPFNRFKRVCDTGGVVDIKYCSTPEDTDYLYDNYFLPKTTAANELQRQFRDELKLLLANYYFAKKHIERTIKVVAGDNHGN